LGNSCLVDEPSHGCARVCRAGATKELGRWHDWGRCGREQWSRCGRGQWSRRGCNRALCSHASTTLKIRYVFLAALVAHITTNRRLADEGAVGYSRALVVEAEVALSWKKEVVAAVVADIATDSGITRVRRKRRDADQEEFYPEHYHCAHTGPTINLIVHQEAGSTLRLFFRPCAKLKALRRTQGGAISQGERPWRNPQRAPSSATEWGEPPRMKTQIPVYKALAFEVSVQEYPLVGKAERHMVPAPVLIQHFHLQTRLRRGGGRCSSISTGQ
jgi:hypothetical protein